VHCTGHHGCRKTFDGQVQVDMPFVLLNKPYRVLSQFRDDQGRRTLAEFVTEKDVYAVGRLDFDSEGLLVLTDDGRLQARISQPSSKLDKHYWVQVEGQVDDTRVRQLCAGVELKDGPAAALSAAVIAEPVGLWPRDPPIRQRRHIPASWLDIQIDEGRNRQVRRMTAAAGLPTLRLIRHRIGPWTLGSLAPGALARCRNRSAWQRLKAY
jgi:23S rRNA pseudouridine2457 synthase